MGSIQPGLAPRWASRLLVWLLVVSALAGCGGGGGGSSDSPGSSGLRVDQALLNIEVEEGETAPEQIITGSITGATEPVQLSIRYTNRAIAFADFALTSTTTGRVRIRPAAWSTLQPGSYSDTVTVSACFDTACARPVPGSPVVVQVNYTLKAAQAAPVLNLATRGVAFAVVPQGARRTASVRVTDTGGTATRWTATSDAAWLNVTASGISGGEIVLTADERGLAAGQHLATVTVRSDNLLVQQTAALRVGLYLSHGVSAEQLSDVPASHTNGFDVQRTMTVPDPIRPVLYTVDEGSIVARHFYSGLSTARWTLPNGQVEALAVSGDGRELYVLDSVNKNLAVIDLDNAVVQRTLPLQGLSGVFRNFRNARLASMRLGDRAVLLINQHNMDPVTIGASPVLDAQTGEELGRVNGSAGGLNGADLSVTPDGRSVFGIQTQVTGVLKLRNVTLLRNSKGTVFGRELLSTDDFPSAGLPAVRPDVGSVFVGLDEYAVSGTALVRVANPMSESYAGGIGWPFTTARAVAADGRVVVLSRRWYETDATRAVVRMFSASGTLQQEWEDVRPASFAQPLLPQSGPGDLAMCISSDGLRAQNNYQLLELSR